MRYKFQKIRSYLARKSAGMFNLYQHMKAAGGEAEPPKESETTGHDRFCQERPRSSYRKKKRRGACRRAQSAAELNPESIAAANKRNAFRIRSVSTDREESEGTRSVLMFMLLVSSVGLISEKKSCNLFGTFASWLEIDSSRKLH